MPHTQTHDGHERDTHTPRARREDTNKRGQSSNRSRTDPHTERERLPATPTYGRTTTETTRYRERASESSTKEPILLPLLLLLLLFYHHSYFTYYLYFQFC